MSSALLDGITIPESTAQYRAGLFDGEGSITTTIVKAGSKRYGPTSFESGIVLMLSMGNTDLRLIKVMHAAYGGHVAAMRKLQGRKQSYTWTLRGSIRVVKALADMMPFLIGKRERAGVAFVLARTYNSHRGQIPLSIEERHMRRMLYDRLKFLNQRGDAAA